MKAITRDRLILSLLLLLPMGVFLGDQTVLQGVILPGPPYFVWILIAAYFLSSRATAGVTAFASILKLASDLLEGTPPWLTAGYFSAMVIVGLGSIVLANKMRQEEALSEEKEQLRVEAVQRAAELEFERARWQATVDNMLDLVTTCDARGSVTYINPAYTRLIERFVLPGLPLEEHPKFYQIFHPDGTVFEAEELPLQKAALLGREIRDIELVHRTSDSREFVCVFSASPLHDDTGRVVGAVAVGRDVTSERRAAAERERLLAQLEQANEDLNTRGQEIEKLAAVAQRQAQERGERLDSLNQLIRVSEQVLAETTVQGLLQRVVDAACTLTGSRIAISGHGYENGVFRIGTTSIVEDDLPCPPGEEFRVQQGGVYLDLVSKEHSLRLTQAELQKHPAWRGLPEGHRPLHGLLGARLAGRDGRAVGLIMLTKTGEGDDEFSEEDEALLSQLAALASLGLQHVEARDEVERRRNELDLANKELESFAYSVSHDLRAPLRHIDGFSEALVEDCADSLDETGKGYLRSIRESTKTMGQLIGDLLELSRVTQSEIHREEVDLSSMAQSIAQVLHDGQPEREVDFIIASGVSARGDKRLLKVVLVNLLENAFKFTSRRQSAVIEFGTTSQEGITEYYVRDNGAGFDMAYSNKLFGAFQRLHSTEEFPGTGVGLATVERIVRRHGGRVRAEGAVDQGATFYFTLS